MVLRQGLALEPQSGDLYHALGLALTRLQRRTEALEALERAAELSADVPRYRYVLGVALHDAGRTAQALEVLDTAHEAYPGNRELLFALSTISYEQGDLGGAREYALKLQKLVPQDSGVLQLVAELAGAEG
jgi:Flp pilus assembly protein TadD